MIQTILSQQQVRVIGSLIEKQVTTPMNYPMTQNSIRVACNQKSNRDPVVDYSDDEVFDILQSLLKLKLVEIDMMDYSRTSKYNQLFSTSQGLERGERAILCELFIRGPQTPGELRSRGERLYKFKDLADLQRCLDLLADRQFVTMLERQPGTKEHRWGHLFCGQPKYAPTQAATNQPVRESEGLEERVAFLEEKMRQMAARIESLERGS